MRNRFSKIVLVLGFLIYTHYILDLLNSNVTVIEDDDLIRKAPPVRSSNTRYIPIEENTFQKNSPIYLAKNISEVRERQKNIGESIESYPAYQPNLSLQTNERALSYVADLKDAVRKDASLLEILRQRELNLRQRYQSCPAGTKITLVNDRIVRNNQPVVIHLRTGYWDHMEFNHPINSHPRWTSKCRVPCRVISDDSRPQQEADMLIEVWHDLPIPRPPDLKPHQRYVAFATEPYFGSHISHADLRKALIGGDNSNDNGTGYVDLVVAWTVDKAEYDFPLTYGYGSEIPDSVWLGNGSGDALDRVRQFLSQRYRLPGLPPFNKRDFFGSLPVYRYPRALDRRGGDVVLVVSNCRTDIWRTDYLRLLIDLLAKPKPEGYGLTVDSYGSCHGRIGWHKDNNGAGFDVDAVKNAGPEWNWTDIEIINDMETYAPNYYPWQTAVGGDSHGFSKNEIVRHYKIFLDFESNLVHGYITEKFFQAFLAETIAVYFGPPSPEAIYNLGSLAGKGGGVAGMDSTSIPYTPHARANIIDGWSYPDPRDMARRINELCTDEKEWQSYFEWRVPPSKRGKVETTDFQIELREEFIQLHAHDLCRPDGGSWMCNMCEWYHKTVDYQCKKTNT